MPYQIYGLRRSYFTRKLEAAFQLMGLPFVYLGYWIDGCRKMSYKSLFTPLELFVDGQWQQQKTEQTETPDTTAVVSLLDPSLD